MSDLPDLRRHWREDAACAGQDQRIWFPVDDRVHRQHSDEFHLAVYRAARDVCDGCPVREQCLTWALDNNEVDHGMFGGLTPRERRRIKRRRRVTPRLCEQCGTPLASAIGRYCGDECRKAGRRLVRSDYMRRRRIGAAI